MTPTDDDQQGADAVRQHPLRLLDSLWDNFEIVADDLGEDRTTLLRNYVRWMTFDDTAPQPRRPDVMPEGLRYTPLPPGVTVQHETEAFPPFRSQSRFVMQVEASGQAIRKALMDAGSADGARYIDGTPSQVSTFDRELVDRLVQIFTDAGMPVLT